MKNFFTFGLLITLTINFYACDKAKKVRSPKDKETDWIKAQELEFLQTADPATNTIPFERLVVAANYTKQLQQTENVNALAWQERGPNNIGGRTRAILISKTDLTGNTVFAGSVGGGLWKTTNFKAANTTWVAVNDFSSNPAITSIAQDPSNANIIYAGTGEGFAGIGETFNGSGQRGNGIYKSTDGGTTWNVLTSTSGNANFHAVNSIRVTSNGNLYAASNGGFCNQGGIYKSVNGGTSFNQVIAAATNGATTCAGVVNYAGQDLDIASNGDVYAVTRWGAGKVWRSKFSVHGSNTGNLNTFDDVTPAGNFERIELAVAPSNPTRVYITCEGFNSTDVTAVFRTDDATSSTWTALTVPTVTANGTPNYIYTRSQAYYNQIIAVDPNDADKIILGGIDLVRSNNGGTTWEQISVWSGFQIPAPLTSSHIVHADQHNVVFDGSGTAIIGNDGGLFYATNLGSTSLPVYTAKNIGYNVTQFYSVALHPTSPNYILAGAQDNGTIRMNGTGISAGTTVLGGDGMMCYIDQTDGSFQVGSYVNLNYRYSRNNGVNWTSITTTNGNNRGLFVNPGDYDNNSNILYAADNAGSYIFFDLDDATPAMSAVAPFEISGRQITAIKAIPNQSANQIWVGTRTTSGIPQIFKITNANDANTVTVTNSPSFTGLTSGYITNIDIHPTNPDRILVTLSNYGINNVWESIDGGQTVTPLDGNLPDMPIRWGLYMKNNALLGTSTQEGGIVLGTETGVWSTSVVNGQSTVWAPNNTGLANVSVRQLAYRNSDNTLAAATHGRGVFTTALQFSTTAINNSNTVTKGFIDNVFGANGNLNIRTGKLNGVKNIQIEMFNTAGQLVFKTQTAYQNSLQNTSQLPKGIYEIRITANNKSYYRNRIYLQ